MLKDVIYYYDKITYKRYELGEIQTDFNFSLVIDGTKDSAKIVVHSYNGNELEPQTIVQHSKTNTWWIVSKDKVERYANESGFYYIHSIELLGAIELLNARDLTDCGFNENTYTISQFLNRLRLLSNYEFLWNIQTSISLAKRVDFVKTFENYTLLSAIREFLDGYNCCAKLTFNTRIEGTNVYIDNKVGSSSTNVVDTEIDQGYFADGSAWSSLGLDDNYDIDELYQPTSAMISIVGDMGTFIVMPVEGTIQDYTYDEDDFTCVRIVYDVGKPFIDFLQEGESLTAVYLEDQEVFLKTQGIASNLIIIPKTGDLSLDTYDIDDFDNVKEIRSIDKDSFGTCVVSNAENVISTKAKTFPATGTAKLSSTTNLIKPEDAILRLPSNVYKGNWIKLTFRIRVSVVFHESGDIESTSTARYFPYNDAYYETFVNEIYNDLKYYMTGTAAAFADEIVENLLTTSVRESLSNKLNKVGSITLYEGNNIVPTYPAATVEITKGNNVPYLARMSYQNGQPRIPFIFTDKETKNMLQYPLQGVAWERGSNIITGFEFLDTVRPTVGYSADLQSTDYYESYQNRQVYEYQYGPGQGQIFEILVYNDFVIEKEYVSFIVNYIPMGDLKIKVDNEREKKDIQLYNQIGKLSDSVAFSKLLNSYAKEISSNNITRYAQYYNYSDVPKVGSIVYDNDTPYIISNISLDFSQNETDEDPNDFGYYIDCEITLSKYIVCKSLLVNPETNIRDYGIPQNFNVKRKQLYRDYYEFSYVKQTNSNVDTPYLNTQQILEFTYETKENDSFVGVIKITYNGYVENQRQWFYQLETTNYYLNKMFYVVLDFLDNNIIGYGSQNVFSGFDISRIFSGMTDTMNTPITYVDDDGKAKGFDIMFCSNKQITDIYNTYAADNGGTSYAGSLYNYSVFIPKDIYDMALNNHKIKISEDKYNKDATEVPVFEYGCQIGDSEDVEIGDNIISQHDNCAYMYSYKIANAGETFTQNNVYDSSFISVWTKTSAAKLIYGHDSTNDIDYIDIELYPSATYNPNTKVMTYTGNPINFTKGRDIAIFRHSKDLQTGKQKSELMFICHKPINGAYPTNTRLRLLINYYKLK